MDATTFQSFCFQLGNQCHNPILGYSPKIIFFQNKNNKSWQRGEGKPGNQVVILEEIQGLIVPHYAKKWRKKMQIQGQIK
jgi:hypothetical protein